MKKRKLVIAALLLVIPVVFFSCYYDYGLDTANSDVVGTYYNVNYDFSQVNTYFLPDSIVHGGADNISRDYDAQIISRVAQNLNSLGWTRVYPGGNDTANVTVMIGVTSTTTTVSYYDDWWGYWGWYGGWYYYRPANKGDGITYGPGWGYYYPYYDVDTYTYTTGTILMTMVDPKNGVNVTTEELTVEWFAAINGLINGSGVSGRINTTIDQAFAQSPYLR